MEEKNNIPDPEHYNAQLAYVQPRGINWNAVAQQQAQILYVHDHQLPKGVMLAPEGCKNYLNKIFKENGWQCVAAKDIYIREYGYCMSLIGICPIHLYEHHSNKCCIVQPPEHSKNARLVCPHDGSFKKLSFAANVLIQ